MHPTGKSTKPILSQILLTVRSRASSKNMLDHKLPTYQETAAEPWCTSCSPPPSSIQSQLFPVALQRQNDLKLLPKCCSATTVFLGMPGHRASAIKLLTPSSSPFTRCHLLQSAPRQIPHRAQRLQAIQQRGRLLFHIPLQAEQLACPLQPGRHLPSRVSILLSGCDICLATHYCPKVLLCWVPAG